MDNIRRMATGCQPDVLSQPLPLPIMPPPPQSQPLTPITQLKKNPSLLLTPSLCSYNIIMVRNGIYVPYLKVEKGVEKSLRVFVLKIKR